MTKTRLNAILCVLALAALSMLVVSTVAGAVETAVVFPDQNLEDAVRDTIDKPEGSIYAADLEQIDRLVANVSDIRDLTGLEYCTHIQYLDLSWNEITDISVLAGLTNLQTLDLEINQITDVSPLAGLTNLTYLNLGINQITDVSPLAGLTNLRSLELWRNEITDVSPLAGLTNLTYLGLDSNEIADVSPLAGLTDLRTLFLSENQITDVSPLAGLTNLENLQLGGNEITDVSPLAGLINLEILHLERDWFAEGLALYNQGNYTGAIQCYDEAIRLDPEYELALANKGLALLKLKRYSEADAVFAEARLDTTCNGDVHRKYEVNDDTWMEAETRTEGQGFRVEVIFDAGILVPKTYVMAYGTVTVEAYEDYPSGKVWSRTFDVTEDDYYCSTRYLTGEKLLHYISPRIRYSEITDTSERFDIIITFETENGYTFKDDGYIYT